MSKKFTALLSPILVLSIHAAAIAVCTPPSNPGFTLSSDSTAEQCLAIGQTGTIDSGVSLTVDVDIPGQSVSSFAAGVKVNNNGSITSYRTTVSTEPIVAILLGDGGVITNNGSLNCYSSSAKIYVIEMDAIGTVTNNGSITATSSSFVSGIFLNSGGTIINNSNVIVSGGGAEGASIFGSSTVINNGSIVASSATANAFGIVLFGDGSSNK